MAETENLYEHDNFFKEVVERNIEDYIDRLKIRNELILSEEIAKNFCLKYILEECASMRLWTELQCNYDLYPNKRSQAMEYIYEKFIKTEQTGLLKPLAIRFKKKEIPKELRFENRIEIQEANLQFNSESQALLKRI